METAIKKAIEGGYSTPIDERIIDWKYRISTNKFVFIVPEYNDKGEETTETWSPEFASAEIWSDSDFWKCLGKALGWDSEEIGNEDGRYSKPMWQSYWHLFIEHLIAGKDADLFFKTLLQ